MTGRAGADDTWQREQRDRILVPGFYDDKWPRAYLLLDSRSSPFAATIQRHGVDTLVTAKGRVCTIEEKIVRWKGRPYESLCLETKSCTIPGREAPGWMVYGAAEWFLYCMMQEDGASLLCHLVEDFQKLKVWFWPKEKEFPIARGDNGAVNRLVPAELISKKVGLRKFLVRAPSVDSQQN